MKRSSLLLASRPVIIILATIMLGAAWGCRGPAGSSRDEVRVPRLRRPTWWSFYRRGIAYSRLERWDAAVSDLETALGMRPGAIFPSNVDRRRARTYGLHMLNDYFPHRELGVCYFYTGRYPEAERELQLSLEMTRSARAKDYLNLVRRARLRDQRENGRLPPARPRIDLDPVEGTLRRRFVRLRGRASSPYRIARVRVDGRPVFFELAQREQLVDCSVSLAPGINEVPVEVEDLAGFKARTTVKVRVDVQGPAVGLLAAVPGRKHPVIEISDDQNLDSVTLNGRELKLAENARHHRISLTRTKQYGNRLQVTAADAAGNKTRFRQAVDELLQASRLHRQNAGYRLASRMADAESGTLAAVQPPPVAYAAAVADRRPPRVRLYPPPGRSISVTTDYYILDAYTRDHGGLKRMVVHLNGDKVQENPFRHGTTMRRSVHRLDLKPGENRVRLRVWDRSGTVATKQFVVKRRMNCLWREDWRMQAALIPPDQSQVPALDCVDVGTVLLRNLLRHPRRLNLVERDPDVLQHISRERRLGQSGRVTGQAITFSKAVKAAEWVLHCYITPWSGNENWDMVVSAVDVETGEIVLTSDIHCYSASGRGVAYRMRGLAEKIKQRLPALSAPIREFADRNKVHIPLGQQDQIVSGMRFLFVAGPESERAFGNPLTCNGCKVEGRVRRVENGHCVVEVQPGPANVEFPPQSQAILR